METSRITVFHNLPVFEWTFGTGWEKLGVDREQATVSTPSLTTISVPLSKVVSHIRLSSLLLLFLYFPPLLLPSTQSSGLPVAHQYINHPDSLFISLSEALLRTLNI